MTYPSPELVEEIARVIASGLIDNDTSIQIARAVLSSPSIARALENQNCGSSLETESIARSISSSGLGETGTLPPQLIEEIIHGLREKLAFTQNAAQITVNVVLSSLTKAKVGVTPQATGLSAEVGDE